MIGLFLRLWQLLPPGSRLRRAIVRRYARVALAAANRGEYEAVSALYHPDVEAIFPPQLAAIGDPGVRGRDEWVRFQRRWTAEWGALRHVPEAVIDLGNRVLLVGRIAGSGL